MSHDNNNCIQVHHIFLMNIFQCGQVCNFSMHLFSPPAPYVCKSWWCFRPMKLGFKDVFQSFFCLTPKRCSSFNPRSDSTSYSKRYYLPPLVKRLSNAIFTGNFCYCIVRYCAERIVVGHREGTLFLRTHNGFKAGS